MVISCSPMFKFLFCWHLKFYRWNPCNGDGFLAAQCGKDKILLATSRLEFTSTGGGNDLNKKADVHSQSPGIQLHVTKVVLYLLSVFIWTINSSCVRLLPPVLCATSLSIHVLSTLFALANSTPRARSKLRLLSEKNTFVWGSRVLFRYRFKFC